MPPRYSISWYSERHLLVVPDDASGDGGRMLQSIVALLNRHPLREVLDVTPAASSILIHLDPAAAAGHDRVPDRIASLLAALPDEPATESNCPLIEIPFFSTPESAPDLTCCSQHAGLAPSEFLDRFCALTFDAAFVGFMPGFAYLRELPKALQVPRLSTPRARVPAGSIAIAGDMAGIYPFSSPGGWRLIGQTPRSIFDPARDRPALIEAGCRVRFVRIDPVSGEASVPVQEGSA